MFNRTSEPWAPWLASAGRQERWAGWWPGATRPPRDWVLDGAVGLRVEFPPRAAALRHQRGARDEQDA